MAGGGSVFTRGVRMQVDILVGAQTSSSDTPPYVVQFMLISGA